jgi:hypothetical protein
MLGWYSDPELRRRTGLGLIKGEARNTLARAIFFNRPGELRDRSFENRPIAPQASISSSRRSFSGTPGIWLRRSPNSHGAAMTFLPN